MRVIAGIAGFQRDRAVKQLGRLGMIVMSRSNDPEQEIGLSPRTTSLQDNEAIGVGGAKITPLQRPAGPAQQVLIVSRLDHHCPALHPVR